ncbi:MAG: UbiH/UbiF/VisC/COQ6 family ubiquinone biosynthesis hydroxylase [Rhodobacteraceae bacterium]|nr:UbiH/UbiF/VisC/COQ6 family ubiquinone biosynthesis hydroxylase [Paracoccaceae bacterium]
MKMDADILIVGGGLNGPALALALASGGLSSVIIDALPLATRRKPAFDGRAYALSLTSVRMLQVLGIWDAVQAESQPMLDIKVSDGRPGEGAAAHFVHFDHNEISEGPMGHMLEDRYLRRALLDAVKASKLITQIAPAKVEAQHISAGHAEVTLEGGKTLRGRLLVGCDGRRSGVAMRAGIARTGHEYHQSGLVCAVSHEKPHNGVAYQQFMPSGPLAILPLKGDRSAIVWTETTERAAVIAAMSDRDFMAELRPRFGDFLGEIKLVGKRFSYPLSLTVATEFAQSRLALVGDAAHGIHYLAGQGLNLGLRDVAVLAEVLLDAARRGEDIGNALVLARYAQWRGVDTAALTASTDLINMLFSNNNPLLRAARVAGLGIVNAIPSARRDFIREAAGLTGDLPRLLKGQPI